jgi:hypothetical protein
LKKNRKLMFGSFEDEQSAQDFMHAAQAGPRR